MDSNWSISESPDFTGVASRLGRASTSLLGLCALVLAAGLSMLWLQSAPSPDPSAVQASEARGPGSDSGAASLKGLAELDPEGAERPSGIAARQGLPVATETQVAPDFGAMARGQLAVRVLEAPSKRPVAGAKVRLLRRGAPPERPGRVPLEWGVHRGTTELSVAETDAAGQAAFPWPPEEPGAAAEPTGEQGKPKVKSYALEASTGEIWGFLGLSENSNTKPCELLLWPDRTVHVTVVHQRDGQPAADREIKLCYYFGEGTLASVCDVEKTDGSGRATFSHVTQHMDWFWPHTEFFAVEPVDYVGQALKPVRIDPDPAVQEVQLRLPELVQLTIEVVGLDGQAYTGEGRVSVCLRDPEAEDPQEDFENAPEGLSAELKDGRVSFDDMDVDQPVWIAFADQATEAPPPQAHRIARTASGSDRFILRLTAAPRYVALRLENPAGELLRTGKASLNGSQLTPPKLGEDTWSCGARGLTTQQGEALTVQVSWTEGQQSLQASLVLPSVLGPSTDLGTVRLAESPVVAAGRVVNSDGLPVAQALIHLYEIDGERRSHKQYSRSDSEGRFRFLGRAGQPTIGLQVSHDDYPHLPMVEFSKGKSDIELRLPAFGLLEGNLIMDPLWQRDFVQALASRQTGSGPSSDRTKVSLSFDECGYLKAALLPGVYRVELRMEADPEPLLRIDGIEIKVGETNRDPRLQDLQLSSTARLISIEPVDLNGEPIDHAWARLLAEGGQGSGGEVEVDARRLHIFTMHPRPSVLVGAEGFMTQLLNAPTHGDKVELLPADRLGLYWASPPPPAAPGSHLTYSHFAQVSGWPDQELPLDIAGSREDIEWVSWPGGDRLKTVVYLRRKKPDGSRVVTELGEVISPIRFQESSLVVPFELPESIRSQLSQQDTTQSR